MHLGSVVLCTLSVLKLSALWAKISHECTDVKCECIVIHWESTNVHFQSTISCVTL
jgi:hypothetical protein